MKLLTIIIPCYNEEKVLPFFYRKMNEIYEKMKHKVDFEYMFIDDGSKDGTLDYIKEVSMKDYRVKYVSFSRNFGKEAAIYAGLEHSKGDYVTLIDADLQHPPEMIIQMYDGIIDGEYDCVAARRVTRAGEPPIRSLFARAFYRIINKISKAEVVDGASDFRLMTRQMVEVILEMKENNRFTKGIFGWVGFNTKWIEYENRERIAGESKWSFWSLFKYAIEGIVGFSTFPLIISSVLGVLFTVVSLTALAGMFFESFILGHSPSKTILIISIILFIGGLQFLCIGILSEYTGKTYLESKHRPIYIEKEEYVTNDK
ncbi:glycosyltransferase family 2 protein [Clostridium oryzae]|uniref:Putative glycosyltransferase CsbB n=1 Tax=Clostridium oryzae TaxID=1450648 RepID=A0A1V4IKD1_9CLOT|nr:glycosyltransferase family 2 protein [Clostridium oryzae]OPJ60329.1 putative glycosyltransferase CsbB [Clostridium oryzae]